MSTPLYGGCASAGILLSWLIVPAAYGQVVSNQASSTVTAAPVAEAGFAPESDSVTDPGVTAADSAAAASPKLVRVTSSFEVTHAGAVLRQVARLFSTGFVRRDAEQVAHMIDGLAAEQSRTWEFSGVRKGTTYPLRVRARIDEFGMLDLDFFTVPALVASVRGAVDGYLNARGL